MAYLIYGIVYQQLDAYLIQPRIFHRSVNIPGVVVVIAATAGGLLNGVLGAILAIPMAAVIMVLYRDVLIPGWTAADLRCSPPGERSTRRPRHRRDGEAPCGAFPQISIGNHCSSQFSATVSRTSSPKVSGASKSWPPKG